MKKSLAITAGASRLTLVLFVMLVFAVSSRAGEFPTSWTWDSTAGLRAEHAALEGKPMPQLDVSDWIKRPITSADMKGKVVVVDFHATWCGSCLAAIPHNNELLKEYGDQGQLVAGVCTSSRSQERTGQVAKARGIEYPLHVMRTLLRKRRGPFTIIRPTPLWIARASSALSG